MIFCSIVCLMAVLIATFSRGIRNAILAFWTAGLSLGGVYLSLGAEFLAIIQWILCTLMTLSLFFFAVMFGEYNEPTPGQRKARHPLQIFTSFLVGISFIFIIANCELPVFLTDLPESLAGSMKTNLQTVGKTLTHKYLLAMECLSLTLFLVLVGGGVIAKKEGEKL